MIRLFLDDLSGLVIGYEYILPGYETYKNDILIENNEENMLLLQRATIENNIYYNDGELYTGEKDTYYADIESKRDKIKELSKLVENEYHTIVDNLIASKSLEEASAIAKNNRDDLENAKTELEEKISAHNREIFKFHAKAHTEKEKDIDWKYYSSICLLIRDENRYLKEWIDWHFSIGIDHIYIYDNGTKENVSDIITALPQGTQDKITVIDWHGEFENVQQEAYNHFLKNYGIETRWVNFIDSDEFIRLTGEATGINEILKLLEAYTAVYGSFVEYNANGKENYEDAPVRERFTQTADVSDGVYHKDFVQPYRIDRMDRHYPKFSQHGNYTLKDTENLYVVDHYYTKSWEEWCQKISRGSSDPNFLKHKNEFFIYNPEMSYLKTEDEIQEYKTRLNSFII